MDFNKQNIHSKVSTGQTHVIDEGLRAIIWLEIIFTYLLSVKKFWPNFF